MQSHDVIPGKAGQGSFHHSVVRCPRAFSLLAAAMDVRGVVRGAEESTELRDPTIEGTAGEG